MRIKLLSVCALLVVAAAGCKLLLGDSSSSSSSKKAAVTRVPQPLVIRTFTDGLAGTAVAGAGGAVWMGTTQGLVRFDLAHEGAPSLVTTRDGLPSNQVTAMTVDATGGLWVATSTGLAHQVKGAWKAMAGPAVGDHIAAMVTTNDGALWLGGPDGLARLNVKKGGFEKLLGDVSVTALATAGTDVWVGTANKYVARVTGDKVQVYGPWQGNEVEKVRSMVATPNGVMVLGEGLTQQRLSFFDGERFFSYRTPGGKGMEWLRRAGDDVLLGGGTRAFTIARDGDKAENGTAGAVGSDAGDDGKLRLVAIKSVGAWPAVEGGARGDLPALAAFKPGEVAPPVPETPVPVETKPVKGKGGKGAKAAKVAKAPAKTAEPAPAPVAASPAAAGSTPTPDGGVPPAAPVVAARVEQPTVPSPVFTVAAWASTLPEGVSAVAPDGPQLIVATRTLGAAIVTKDEVKRFRRGDVGENAEALSVACTGESDCWFTTGAARAWHWDGKTIEAGDVDPEAGSKVMAVLNPPNGSLLAIHRSAAESQVRFSNVLADGRWNAMIYRDLAVPAGVPDVTFAQFAPNKHLWVGLRYIDKDHDANDYGAAEVDFDKGKTTYHRTAGVMAASDPSLGAPLPNDVVAAYFRADESWFGTRSSVVRLKGANSTVFGEPEGFQRELVHDLIDGADGKLWAATVHGVAEFDGKKWAFPNDTAPLQVRATALAKDYFGAIYVGTRSGVLQCIPPDPEKGDQTMAVTKMDITRGLADNNVFDLAADKYGRIWVLTEKGLSVLSR